MLRIVLVGRRPKNGLRSNLSLVGVFDRAVMTGGLQHAGPTPRNLIVQPQLLALSSAHSQRSAAIAGRIILQVSTASPCFDDIPKKSLDASSIVISLKCRYTATLYLTRLQDAGRTSGDAR
jgi:hypothetical protein